MDNYPEHLAPDFDRYGAVVTPFSDWWPRSREYFPSVPEELAREWIHRHWGQSKFSWLPSSAYDFSLETVRRENLSQIRTTWSGFDKDNNKALMQGMYICGEHPTRPFLAEPIWLVRYMKSKKQFPSPIVILDNTDRHLSISDYTPAIDKNLPQAMILIEGHTRLNIGLFLASENRLCSELNCFILRKK